MAMTLSRRGVLALGAAMLLAPATVLAARPVKVNKRKVVVVRNTFDPRNPPKEMPPLGPGADAITHFKFGCGTRASYEVTGQRQERGACVCSARINDMDVDLDLEITVWVPTNARKKLIDHEEGHREIGEMVYQKADEYARAEARKFVGRTVTGRGRTRLAAAETAVKSANHDFCEAYLQLTAVWADRVGNRYDEITNHGRRNPPSVEDAIAEAFEREPPTDEPPAAPPENRRRARADN